MKSCATGLPSTDTGTFVAHANIANVVFSNECWTYEHQVLKSLFELLHKLLHRRCSGTPQNALKPKHTTYTAQQHTQGRVFS